MSCLISAISQFGLTHQDETCKRPNFKYHTLTQFQLFVHFDKSIHINSGVDCCDNFVQNRWVLLNRIIYLVYVFPYYFDWAQVYIVADMTRYMQT